MNSDMTQVVERFEHFLRNTPSRRKTKRSASTVELYLRYLNSYCEWLDQKGISDFKQVTAEDLEDFVLNYKSRFSVWDMGRTDQGKRKRKVVKKDISWQGRNTQIVVLMIFYKWLNGTEEDPEVIRKVKKLMEQPPLPERSRIKTSADLLSDNDIRAILKACEDANTQSEVRRNRALISSFYEGGFRDCEIVGVKVKELEPTEYGFRIWVNGKTGRRSLPLIDSARYLQEWLNVHPLADNPEAPLFVSLASNNRGQALTTTGLRTTIRRLGSKAGLKKRIYPYLFRHTRATELTAYTSEAYLRKMQGWTPTSPMPAFYVHLSGKDVEREVLRIRGIVSPEQVKPYMESPTCPHCGAENQPHITWCVKCGKPLKTGLAVVKELSESDQRLSDVERQLAEMNRILQDLLGDYITGTIHESARSKEKP